MTARQVIILILGGWVTAGGIPADAQASLAEATYHNPVTKGGGKN